MKKGQPVAMNHLKKGRECYNCGNNIGLSDQFCHFCGQSNHPTKLTVGILVKDFVDNFFNLDSRFFKTLVHIFSPTFLTREYLAGRRVKYANPIRLFFILILLLFAVLAFFLNSNALLEDIELGKDDIFKTNIEVQLFEKYNHYIDSLDLPQSQINFSDSIKTHVFKNIKSSDSSYIKGQTFNTGSINIDIPKILISDISELSYEELFEKYEINGYWNRIITKQIIKARKDPQGTVQFIISNSFWIIIFTILFSALLLKIIYIRHGIYYIEHIILLCNTHSLLFLLFIISLLIQLWIPETIIITDSILSIFPLLFIIVFKRYYQQGIFKTLIKFLIFTFGYFFFMSICSILVLLISFLLF